MTTIVSQRGRWIVVALLGCAFVGGIATGVIIDRLSNRATDRSARITSDLSSVLDGLSLTKEQRAQADTILERSAPRTEEAMFDIAARLSAISDSVDRQLRAILTPSQRSKLDSLRRRPVFLLKRRTANGSTSVDTVYPWVRSRDSTQSH
jgi:uncharacterized membrane-anchored protein YhcB (DUF1043 family)